MNLKIIMFSVVLQHAKNQLMLHFRPLLCVKSILNLRMMYMFLTLSGWQRMIDLKRLKKVGFPFMTIIVEMVKIPQIQKLEHCLFERDAKICIKRI